MIHYCKLEQYQFVSKKPKLHHSLRNHHCTPWFSRTTNQFLMCRSKKACLKTTQSTSKQQQLEGSLPKCIQSQKQYWNNHGKTTEWYPSSNGSTSSALPLYWLRHCGHTDTSLAWFKSYLTDRVQVCGNISIDFQCIASQINYRGHRLQFHSYTDDKQLWLAIYIWSDLHLTFTTAKDSKNLRSCDSFRDSLVANKRVNRTHFTSPKKQLLFSQVLYWVFKEPPRARVLRFRF